MPGEHILRLMCISYICCFVFWMKWNSMIKNSKENYCDHITVIVLYMKAKNPFILLYMKGVIYESSSPKNSIRNQNFEVHKFYFNSIRLLIIKTTRNILGNMNHKDEIRSFYYYVLSHCVYFYTDHFSSLKFLCFWISYLDF